MENLQVRTKNRQVGNQATTAYVYMYVCKQTQRLLKNTKYNTKPIKISVVLTHVSGVVSIV